METFTAEEIAEIVHELGLPALEQFGGVNELAYVKAITCHDFHGK